jgi:hypothetical protein
MVFRSAAVCLLIAAVLVGCDKRQTQPTRKTVGNYTTLIGMYVGSAWGGGYSVHVSPEEYVVVEHANCPEAKESGAHAGAAKGLCVLRITREQSDRFEAALEPFKRNAVPLQSYSVTDPYVRPDGQSFKKEATDSTIITFQWTGTQGAKIANFYTGCDEREFGDFYKSVLAVTDLLPIQQIIGKH